MLTYYIQHIIKSLTFKSLAKHKASGVLACVNAIHPSRISKGVIISLMLFLVGSVNAATRYSVATGNWASTAVWSATSNGTAGASAPVAGDIVYIEGNRTVTVNANAACTDVSIATGSALTINGFNFTSSGTVTISGTLTNTSATATKTFSNVIISGGTWTSNNATEAYAITSLTLSNSTINGTAIGTFNVSGNLLVTTGTTNNLNGLSITVGGTTTINGTMNILSVAGNKTFVGLVTINSTGTVTNTTVNESMTFRGGITNNGGVFNIGTGAQTFDTNAQSLNGTLSIPSMTVTGVTVTNNGNLTVATALAGSGGLTNVATGTLNIGGTSGITALTATAVGNTVNYNGGAQTVKAITYSNLTLSNSGIKTLQAGTTTISGNLLLTGTASSTLVANLSIAGDLNIGTGTTLDLATFTANRSVAGGTLTVAGTMVLGGTTGGQGNTSNFPTNFSTVTLAGGTVNYDNATGGQTIYSTPTYSTLTLGNTSGTQTAGGNLTATTLNNNTNAADILNMATNTLTVTTANNTGTIQTQNTTSAPISSGLTWGGTVNYNAATGAQTVVAGTYSTLTLGNTSGTQTAGGNLTATTLNNNTNAADILNMGTNTLTVTTPNNTGTIRTQNTSGTPVSTGKTWGGTVIFDGSAAQTIPAATFTNLTVNNSAGESLAANVVVSGVLTLTNGVLSSTTGNTFSLTLTNTTPSAVSGGSATSYISTNVATSTYVAFIRYLAASSTYVFPVGNSTGYCPFTLSNIIGTGTITAQVQSYAGNPGGTIDSTLLSKSTAEFWRLNSTGSFTSASVSIQRPTAISPYNVIATSSTQGGKYTYIGGTAGTNYVNNSTTIPIVASPLSNFFVFAQGNPSVATTATSLTGFIYKENKGPSAQISNFKVSGYSLTSNVKVEMYRGNFEISTTNSPSFVGNSVIYLPVVNGRVVATDIYVRMKAGLVYRPLNYTDSIIVSADGVTSKYVICNGSVTAAALLDATPPPSGSLGSYTFGGGPTTGVSFTYSGTLLNADVTVTPPADFEISTTLNGTYQSTAFIPYTTTGFPNATLTTKTLYVRMKSGLGVGTHTQDIVVSSDGAVSKSVTCTGVVNAGPVIYNSVSLLSGFVTTAAVASGYQTFQVSGSTLSGYIVLTPQAGFEISLSPSSGYVSTTSGTPYLSIAPSSGTVALTTIYVRMKSGLTVGGNYNNVNVVITSTNAITKSVSCSGIVVNAAATMTVSKNSLVNFGYLAGSGPSSTQYFTVSGVNLGNNSISITPTTDYEISINDGATFAPTNPIVLTPNSGTVSPTNIYVRLKAGLVAGLFNSEVINVALGLTTQTVTCSGQVFTNPLVTASVTGSPFCTGSSISLVGTGTAASQYWTGPNNFYSTSLTAALATNNATTGMTGTYTLTGNVVVGGNLISNGDFESGNISFGSGYNYRDSTYRKVGDQQNPAQATYAYGALYYEGDYAILTIPHNVHVNFTNTGPHGGKKQMVINGNTVAGVVIWSQTVQVVAGKNYQFTYWEQNVCNPNPSQLQLYVNGVAAGPIYTASSTVGLWTQFLYNTSSGSNNVLNLELVNQNTIAGGNDFALDDIVFQQVLSSTSSVDVVVTSTVLTPSVTIVASQTNPVNSGVPVTFTATPVNGGSNPVYQWYKGGVNGVGGVAVSGATSSTYTYVPANNDNIYCTLTASGCVSPNLVTSNTLNIQITTPANPNYWVGTVSNVWSNVSNWTDHVPLSGEDVVFATIYNNKGSAAVKDLYVDAVRTIGSLIDSSSVVGLVVPAGTHLTVNNSITTKGNPDRILIQAAADQPNGSLIFHNAQNYPVNATVEMYSKAYIDKTTNPADHRTWYKWQYFGIPITSVVTEPTFTGSWVRAWHEEDPDVTTHWRELGNDSILKPFYGYEIVQPTAKKIIFKGQLINKDFNFGKLPFTSLNTSFGGQSVFANSYTAAIDVKQLTFGSQTEATVYMYNTGTIDDWTVMGTGASSNSTSTPGQYTSIPQQTSGNLMASQVPSMQSMLVKAMSNSANATLSLSYNSVITKNTDNQRVKSESDENNSDKVCTLIEVAGAKFADKMWIFSEPTCTHRFDNGWDGFKIIGSSLAPQIFAKEQDGEYQVDAVSDINNVNISFQAGSDVEYQMTFTHLNSKRFYPAIYLVDLVENKIVDITETGSTYKFLAESTPSAVNRFKIVTRHYENTASDNTSNLKIFSANGMVFVHNLSTHKGGAVIYDISGHLIKQISFGTLGVTALSSGMIPGAYIVKCATDNESVAKRVIVQ